MTRHVPLPLLLAAVMACGSSDAWADDVPPAPPAAPYVSPLWSPAAPAGEPAAPAPTPVTPPAAPTAPATPAAPYVSPLWSPAAPPVPSPAPADPPVSPLWSPAPVMPVPAGRPSSTTFAAGSVETPTLLSRARGMTAPAGSIARLTPAERADLLLANPATNRGVRDAFQNMTSAQRRTFAAGHPAWTERNLSGTWRRLTPGQKNDFLQEHPEYLRQLQDQWNAMTVDQRTAFASSRPGLQARVSGTADAPPR